MAKVIWKFPVKVTDDQWVGMPSGAKIFFVGEQSGQVCLWAEVDPAAPTQSRLIRIFGTGQPMPNNPGFYIGSFMLHDGALVFHAYDTL